MNNTLGTSQTQTPKLTLVYNRKKGFKMIEIRVYFPSSRKRMYISTSVKTDYWNEQLQILDIDDLDYYEKILKVRSKLEEINILVSKMVYEGMDLTMETLDTLRGKKSGINSQIDFIKFCKTELELQNISFETRRHNLFTIDLIAKLKSPLFMTDIDFNMATHFDVLLRKKYTNQNTITRHHKVFRKYVKRAAAKMMIKNEMLNNFNYFKVPGYTTGKKPLSDKQLESLEDIKLKMDDSRRIYLDAFLFSCYTGLRISDVITITPENFTEYNGELRLEKIMVKLRKYNKAVNLPLNKLFAGKPAKIIKPYLDIRENNEKIFDRSPQTINEVIKVIASEVGIPYITFHQSRHTFLTNLAAKTGDVFKVMEYGGIGTIDTAQGYIKLARKNLDISLDSVQW